MTDVSLPGAGWLDLAGRRVLCEELAEPVEASVYASQDGDGFRYTAWTFASSSRGALSCASLPRSQVTSTSSALTR